MSEDIFAPTIARIRIVNHNDKPLTDRCDNVEYMFPPGIPRDIPLDAARHVFGYHADATEDEIKAHCCKRFGWNTPEHVATGKDIELFDNLDIRPVSYQLVEVSESGQNYKTKRRGRPRAEETEQASAGESE